MPEPSPDQRLAPGTRVRVNEHSPWPERVGAKGVIVDPETFGGIYPADARWKRWAHEVIVLLDDDPLMSGESRARHWSCVMDWRSIDVV